MWDWNIVSNIWLCLAIAALLGGIIGWLLRSLSCKSKCDEYEASLSAKDSEIAKLKTSIGKVSKNDAEIAEWKNKVSSLEEDLRICLAKQTSMEGELKDWSTKAATLGSVGAVAVGSGGDSAKLQAEIDALKVKLSQTEGEKEYLLTQVKKAESGESISRVVSMEERDDLELVHGIGPVIERMLYDEGIYFFKEISCRMTTQENQ